MNRFCLIPDVFYLYPFVSTFKMRNRGFRTVCIVFFFISCFITVWPQPSGNPVLSALHRGDTIRLESLTGPQNINGMFGTEQHTLLIYALYDKNPVIVNFLLAHGASPDSMCHGLTPLMLAAELNDIRAAGMLIRAGANVNHTDTAGNTALCYAASSDHKRMARFLLQHKAWLNHTNNKHYTALDLANLNGNRKTAEYLLNYFKQHLPSWHDGPHIRFQGKHRLFMYYIKHDSVPGIQRTRLYGKRFRYDSLPVVLKGFGVDTSAYTIQRCKGAPPWEYTGIDRIFVMGDVHGGYQGMMRLLEANNIIDHNRRWIFGKGHLVFLGDIFDRGDQVTEALWCIYRLQQEALLQGGRVHLILGNHEIMMIRKNYSYLAPKYFYINQRLNKDFSSHFSSHTVLGQWIRTCNTVEVINGILFVHGGISPDVLSERLCPGKINNMVRACITKNPNRRENQQEKLLMGNNGPLWYRGSIEKILEKPVLTQAMVDSTLAFYNVSHIVVGHVAIPHIETFFDGKVIATDIPFYVGLAQPEGLLIQNGKFFKAGLSGKLNLLYTLQ